MGACQGQNKQAHCPPIIAPGSALCLLAARSSVLCPRPALLQKPLYPSSADCAQCAQLGRQLTTHPPLYKERTCKPSCVCPLLPPVNPGYSCWEPAPPTTGACCRPCSPTCHTPSLLPRPRQSQLQATPPAPCRLPARLCWAMPMAPSLPLAALGHTRGGRWLPHPLPKRTDCPWGWGRSSASALCCSGSW